MMTQVNWPTLLGRIVGGRYELQRLLNAGDGAAEYSASTPAGAEVAVTVAVPGHMAPFHSVAALNHPNIRRVLDGGSDEVDGKALEYIVLDAAEETLAPRMKSGPMPVADFALIAPDLVSALAYLHGRELVYMHLAPESVVRAGRSWKLGNPEFGHREGNASPAITRAMLSRSGYVPPEAFNGVVSPAWDVWSFGVLTQRALSGPPPQDGPKRRHRPTLPPPYETLVAQCLEPEPHLRVTVADIARMLNVDTAAAEASARPAKRRARTYDAVVAPSSTATVTEDRPESVRAAGAPRPEPPGLPMFERRRPPRQLVLALIPLLIAAAAVVFFSQRRQDIPPAADGAQSKNRSVERATSPAPAPVEKSAPAAAKPSPMDTQEAAASPSDRAYRRAAVYSFLKTWAATTRQRDPQTNGSLYAPRVDQFFNRTNVSREDVIREKTQLFRNIATVRRFDISNIRIESLTPQRAIVNFRKQWDFRGARYFAGAERARLVLTWTGNGWQIAREQELHVEWVHRGPASEGD